MQEEINVQVSVIVPVYNSEYYIYDCVESVLNQTYTKFELLLVDDGSCDNSKEICEQLCIQDKRIRYIYQDHRGVSAARNVGMKEASGKYFFFLDSDDFIHPQLLETLYRLQEENQTVIAAVGFDHVGENMRYSIADWKFEKESAQASCYLKRDCAMKPEIFSNYMTQLHAIGGKLILRKGIGTLCFDERLTQGEDTKFVFELIVSGADVTVLFRDWYFYRDTVKSKGKRCLVESCKDRYKVERDICDYEIEKNLIEDAKGTEWIILCEIVKWSKNAWRNNNLELEKYLKRLIKREKKIWIFSQLDLYRKIMFYIGCEFYPLYWLIERIWHWCCEIRKNFFSKEDFPYKFPE